MPASSPNAILQIIKGVAKVPQDARSAEIDLDSINLLDPNGFSCETYEPQIPNLKNNAVWADSPITNGRALISGALGNVTETISLNLTAGSLVQMAALLSKLVKIRQDCNDFWDTFAQIDPVYLKHQIEGEPGPRYALLYNIEIHVESPNTPGTASRTITLSIEREEGWRGIAPGDNPKHWARIVTNTESRWNTTTAALLSTSDHLVSSAQLYNVVEWLNNSTIRKANYIDIPAASIPGDLPALAMINFDVPSGTGLYTLLLSRSTKPTSVTLRDGNTARQFYNLAAAHVIAAYNGTDTALEADTGAVIYPPASPLARRAKITFATDTTDVVRLTWTSAPTGGLFASPPIEENMFRGMFMAFARCRQVGGASGDVKMHLRYGTLESASDPLAETTEVIPTIQAGTGNTTDWPVTYMGVVTIPTATRAQVSSDGRGIQAIPDDVGNGFQIDLYARSPGGTTPDLYFCDLILIPFDEQAVKIDVVAGTGHNVVLDTTGYFLRGLQDPFAQSINNLASTQADSPLTVELSGSGITLKPGVNNRIYFFLMDGANLSTPSTANLSGMYIDIVPRWSGLRDI